MKEPIEVDYLKQYGTYAIDDFEVWNICDDMNTKAYLNTCNKCKQDFGSKYREAICPICLRKIDELQEESSISNETNEENKMNDWTNKIDPAITSSYCYGAPDTTNTQVTSNYDAAAESILDVLSYAGFTTENPFDEKELKQKIVEAIRRNMEGNVNYASITG